MKATSINDPGVTGSLYVEKKNRYIFVTMHKPQVQVDKHLHIKPNTLYLIEKKVRKP